jgi:hypothetical protein
MIQSRVRVVMDCTLGQGAVRIEEKTVLTVGQGSFECQYGNC